jgi:uncharacterized membrane protein
MDILRWVGMAVLITGYSALAHYTNVSAHKLGPVTSLAPLMLLALTLAWHAQRRLYALCALGALCIALYFQRHAIEQHFGAIYWLQDTGLQLLLFATFGRTLLAGQKPLCVRFAEAAHSPLSARHETYARHVTVAWTLFFGAMALVSTLLFFAAPIPVWSAFANFLVLPLIALMFLTEYRLRLRLLPETQGARLLDGLRAFKDAQTK